MKRFHTSSGFTLLENLIAMSIVVVGGLAVFALLNQTLLSAKKNQETIVVTNLAREGLEIIRSIRDSSGAGYADLVNGNWIVDSVDNYSITTAADSALITQCNNCDLYITSGQYSHTASVNPTGLKRMIIIADGNHIFCEGGGTACEKVVTVQVLRQGSQNPYELVGYITDWKQ